MSSFSGKQKWRCINGNKSNKRVWHFSDFGRLRERFKEMGVYTIVDGFFIGNSIGDLGLSAVNIAYPIVAVIQALGTGMSTFYP